MGEGYDGKAEGKVEYCCGGVFSLHEEDEERVARL